MKRLLFIFLLFLPAYSYAGGLNANTFTMLHANGSNGSTTITDSSLAAHTFTCHNANCQLDNSAAAAGTNQRLGSNAFFNATDSYADSPDSADWDFFASTLDNWTIDFRFQTYDTSIDEVIIAQRQDSTNRWQIMQSGNDASTGFHRAFIQSAGAVVCDNNPGTSSFTVNQWKHYALIKVGTAIGFYVDGVQKSFCTLSAGVNLTSPLYIGNRGDGAQNVYGWIDELRIQHSNPFGAAPNVGLTDTITVQTTEYSTDTSPTKVIIIN